MTTHPLDHPRTRAAFRAVRLLVGAYFVLSVFTLVVVFLLRDDPVLVTGSVWVRGVILVVVSALTWAFAASAARGNERGLLRLRLVTAIQVVAIVVLVALPGTFPLWMKLEQVVCGLLLLGVVAVTTSAHMRSLFPLR